MLALLALPLSTFGVPAERAGMVGQSGSGARIGGLPQSKVSNAKPGVHLVPDDGTDPLDPRGPDFEPRAGPEQGGSKWTFGRVHAAMHHVMEEAPEGNATAVYTALNSFSSEHNLDFGLGDVRGRAVQAAVRKAIDAVEEEHRRQQIKRQQQMQHLEEERQRGVDGNSTENLPRRGLHVAVLGAGIGDSLLWCLPPLLEIPDVGFSSVSSPHEVVSVERDDRLSHAAAELVRHALGEAVDKTVRHLPLIPSEDTSFHEVLETLHGGFELGPFDVVLLEGRDREQHAVQVQTLLQKGALRDGAIVHAEGPGRGDAATERFIKLLGGDERRGGRFDFEVHHVWDNADAIIATHRGRDSGSNAEL
eukprot:TRINITY_DN43191_c0_g1_i1.p1 TRINITY_DN43191_c0_g1~~TRINITY_DN43191_c0_g1_i1.p1  ORF type:complete len:421 (-),score=58.44 TRINITY_DN43191_c0_g1_i1:159-1244(-)